MVKKVMVVDSKKPKVKSNKDLTRAVNKLVKKVGNVKPDLKYHQIAVTVNPDTTVRFQLLNGITQGIAENERIGANAKMKYIEVKYNLYVDLNVGAALWQAYRIMIVRDKQTNLATPPASMADGPLFSTSLATYSPLDPKWHLRYDILHDEFFTLNNLSNESNGHRTRSFKVNLNNINTVYDGTTNTVASIASNSIFLLYFNTEATAQSAMAIRTLLRYTDV